MQSTDNTKLERDLRLDLSTRHLRALVGVAQYRNFAAAATDLGVSQPTLTRTVRRAEDMLGVALFTRTTRRVSLTEAGQEFIPLAQRLLGDLGLGLRNIRELAKVERGQLTIATLMTVAHGVLPPAVARFAERYPSVGIDLREGVQASVLEEVRSGSADFGLGDEADIGGPLESDRLGVYGFSVVLPKGHRLLRKESLTLEDIADERLVAMPKDAAARRTLDAVSLAAGVSLNSHFTTSQFTTAFELVSVGLGVAVVPSIFFARPHPADVSSRPLDAPGAVQRLAVITRSDRVLTPAASAFLDVLRECWPNSEH
ncbi:MAG: DNA-binding transcriptional LysR family regulator [Gammaproteobacteria bacterium]|jgi:DNA-binding transcriptional LysR family regulator